MNPDHYYLNLFADDLQKIVKQIESYQTVLKSIYCIVHLAPNLKMDYALRCDILAAIEDHYPEIKDMSELQQSLLKTMPKR